MSKTISALISSNLIIVFTLFLEPLHMFLVVVENILPPITSIKSTNIKLMTIHLLRFLPPNPIPDGKLFIILTNNHIIKILINLFLHILNFFSINNIFILIVLMVMVMMMIADSIILNFLLLLKYLFNLFVEEITTFIY